jgi:GrpB-like predicted nucleotidyltransferase (UPF0157 family)
MKAVVVPYDPAWPALYEAAKVQLMTALGINLEAIEHMGSTAVPGLASKPVIDIVIGVHDLAATVPIMTAINYEYVPRFETLMPFRRLFVKYDSDVFRSGYHVHIVATGHPFMHADVTFRDHMRTHTEDREQYQALKLSLSGQLIDEYYQNKSDFVVGIKRKLGLPLF